MTKQDLKDGMVVEIRNLGKYLVLGESFLSDEGYNLISFHKDDLKWHSGDRFDIIKVYKVVGAPKHLSLVFKDKYLELI